MSVLAILRVFLCIRGEDRSQTFYYLRSHTFYDLTGSVMLDGDGGVVNWNLKTA